MPKTRNAFYGKTLLIVVILAVVSYSFYSLYTENKIQSATIANLQQQLSEKLSSIEALKNNVGNLTVELGGLKSNLQSKELTITDLSNRLGLTKIELGELTPIIKDYYAVGVRGDGTGVLIPLEVKMVKGTGVVSVNIKNIELRSGAQESVRIASKVAQDYTGVDLTKRDITVTFVNTEMSLVALDGPSAGAAITLTVIAGAINKTPNAKILITGTIESDGSVGPIGGVKEKAMAAVGSGATVFLVPFGQKTAVSGIEIAEVKKIQEVVNLVLK